jgi:hypothetical protein
MNSEVREYLEEVVSTIEHKFKSRGFGNQKMWEMRLLAGAKKLLNENQADLPLAPSVTDAELNAEVRRHSHAGLV